MGVDEAIARISALPPGRVRPWEGDSVAGIELGIVFVLALWSGPAISRLKDLSELLAGEFTDVEVPVLVCDTDVSGAGLGRRAGAAMHGWGEAIWVRQGEIVACLTSRDRATWIDAARRHCAELRRR